MDPPDRVSWVELLAEYRRRNHKSGYRLVDPKRGALHAKCRQLGVLFNSKDVWLTSTQQEQLLSSLVPEHVVDDPSMIFYFECVGHHRRRTEITKDGCRLKTENEADFHRTAPYDRLLCIFHVGQARHINLGHLLTRLMTDLGEEFIDTQKWVEWCADTRLTADTYFFLSEDEYEQIRDYVRREPIPPEPSPSVDAPAPPDSDPPGDDSSEEPPVQDPPPEEPAPDPVPADPGKIQVPQGGTLMSTMDAFSAHGATARAAREARQQKLDDARATLDDFVDEFNDKVKDAFLGVFTIDEVAEMFAQACKDETDPNVLAASVVGMVKFLRLLFPKADEATATARANEAIKKVNS